MPALVPKLPLRAFEIYSQTTEKIWEHRGRRQEVNAYTASEVWLNNIKGGSKVMDTLYNIAVIPAGNAKAPEQLHEEAISERSLYLYCGYIRGRLPRHLRWFARWRKR